jgi:hypothetical protein
MENYILLFAYFWACCAVLTVSAVVALAMGWIDWTDLN